MSDQPVRYWIHGVKYFKREDCDRECKSIHPRLGIKEAPYEVVDASAFDAQAKECERLREALERADKLVGLVTIKQVLDGGDAAISASGINPWCVNEGLADGSEHIGTDFIDRALHGEHHGAKGVGSDE